MHTRKPWPMLAAQAAFSSWERPSPNGHATRLPTTAQRFQAPNGGKPMDSPGVRYPASNTPSPLPDSRTIFKIEVQNVSQAGAESPKLHFLEISPDRRKFQLCETFRTARAATFESIPSTAAVLAVLPQPRSPGVALLVYGSREVLSRHALATDGSMMAPQTIRPQVALVAFSPDLRVCAAARCIRSAHALANLLRRSLRFARASETACRSRLITHSV